MNRYLILIFVIALNGCSLRKDARESNVTSSNRNDLAKEFDEVLILYTDSAYKDNSNFELLNQDGTYFDKIVSIEGNEPSLDSLKDNILAYYPDYYIVHFNAMSVSDTSYSLKIGSTNKLIKKGKYMECLTWPDYVLRFFSTTNNENPLRMEPSDASREIEGLNYGELNFRNVQISGEWVKVVCNKDCEGCIGNELISGWLRWRRNNEVILKIYYTC